MPLRHASRLFFARAFVAAASTSSSASAASLFSSSSSSRAFSSAPIQAAAAAAKAAGKEAPPRRARWLLFLPPAAAAFLCHWQLERREWKVKLLAEREEALKEDPLTLEELLSRLRERKGRGTAPKEMTRVVVAAGNGNGRKEEDSFSLDASSTFLVGPRPRSFGGSTVGGSLVVTPLRRKGTKDEGALVVRGWVPSGWKGEEEEGESGKPAERSKGGKRPFDFSPPAPPPAPPAPPLLCVLRDSESPSRFVPENNASKNLWHWIDGGEMAVAAGLPRGTTPLLEIVSSPSSSSSSDSLSSSSSSSSSSSCEDFGAEEEEKTETEAAKKQRPSLMEVLGGRTAERGSGSPLVPSPSTSSSSSSSSPPSSTSSSPSSSSTSSSSLRSKKPQPRPPQPRSLEEISQVPVSPGQHLQYAATWGTLAAATTALAVKVGRRGRGR